MQRSEHTSDLFAGLEETDPPFLWPGDIVGIALTIVAASRSPVRRIPLPGDLPRVACAWQAAVLGTTGKRHSAAREVFEEELVWRARRSPNERRLNLPICRLRSCATRRLAKLR